MKVCRAFLRDNRAASAAEFALVVPTFLIFLLGTIDVGRYMWTVNEIEKATQIGARWAVATNMVCSGLIDWSFTEDQDPAVPQGTTIDSDAFPGVEFAGGTATTCTCTGGGGGCSFPLDADTTAYNALVARMNSIYGGIGPGNVSLRYENSGLGYAGDPNGPDVAPLVTVTVSGVGFRPITLGSIANFQLPASTYSLTSEDGEGDVAYY